MAALTPTHPVLLTVWSKLTTGFIIPPHPQVGMPSTAYKVYIGDDSIVPEIEQYCAENDVSASEFFREAARRELQLWYGEDHGGDQE